jgi:hypothetical protein
VPALAVVHCFARSLRAAIGPTMWMLMSTIVVLASDELNSELVHQIAKDSTDESGRGAPVADKVGVNDEWTHSGQAAGGSA